MSVTFPEYHYQVERNKAQETEGVVTYTGA